MDLCKWVSVTHFTHPPFPHTTPSAFLHQPEWQAYDQMREELLHNRCFATLFYKALLQMGYEIFSVFSDFLL